MTSTTMIQSAADTTANKLSSEKSGAGKSGARKSGASKSAGAKKFSPLRTLAALPAFGLAGYLVWIAFTNIAYPLRPALGLPGYTRGSWGGPTYAGVWAVHGAAGLAMLAVAFLITLPSTKRFLPRRSR